MNRIEVSVTNHSKLVGRWIQDYSTIILTDDTITNLFFPKSRRQKYFVLLLQHWEDWWITLKLITVRNNNCSEPPQENWKKRDRLSIDIWQLELPFSNTFLYEHFFRTIIYNLSIRIGQWCVADRFLQFVVFELETLVQFETLWFTRSLSLESFPDNGTNQQFLYFTGGKKVNWKPKQQNSTFCEEASTGKMCSLDPTLKTPVDPQI